MDGLSQHKAMLVNQHPVYWCNSGSWKTKQNKKPTKLSCPPPQKISFLWQNVFPWQGCGWCMSITVTLAHGKIIPGSFLIFLLSWFNCEILQIMFPIWSVPGFSRTFVNAFISPQWVQPSFSSVAFSLQAGTTCWAFIPRDCNMQ